MEKQKKEIKVLFIAEFQQQYNQLLETIETEKQNGIENSFHNQLMKSVGRNIELLKSWPDYGTRIPQKLIPNQYIEKFQINNLWKLNLPNGWRSLYTLHTTTTEINVVLIDYMDHDRYNTLFHYRKR